MKDATITEASLVRYLLGQMDGAEQEQIEARYIGNRELLELLQVVEDELIDAYVRGGLSKGERDRFEKHFLRSAERRQRVEVARQWLAYVSRPAAGKKKAGAARHGWWREFLRMPRLAVWLPLAATLLLALGGAWLLIQTARLNNQLEQARSESAAREEEAREMEQQVAEERRRSQQLIEELERERNRPGPEGGGQVPAPPPRSGIVSFVLALGLARDAGAGRRLEIPPDAKQVRLQVNFKVGNYPSYRAALETVEGRVVWSRAGLRARPHGGGKRVTLSIPARVLRDDDYVLMLSGVPATGEPASVGEYAFRIVRK